LAICFGQNLEKNVVSWFLKYFEGYTFSFSKIFDSFYLKSLSPPSIAQMCRKYFQVGFICMNAAIDAVVDQSPAY